MNLEYVGGEKSNIDGIGIDNLSRRMSRALFRRKVKALVENAAPQHALHPSSMDATNLVLGSAAESSEKGYCNKCPCKRLAVGALEEAVQDQWRAESGRATR